MLNDEKVCKREWNTTVKCMPVPYVYFETSRPLTSNFVNGGRVSNSTDLLSIVAMWLVFHCSIAITTDFARGK